MNVPSVKVSNTAWNPVQDSSSLMLKIGIDNNNLTQIAKFASEHLNRPLPEDHGLPLLYAIQENKKDLIPIMLKNGADPLQREPGHPSPLEYAVLNGSQEILPLLVSHVTALEFENVKKSLENGVDRKCIQRTARSIQNAYSEKQRLALASDLEKILNLDRMNIIALKEDTLLHLVIQSGSLSLLERVLKDPNYIHLINQPNRDGLTPLHYAIALKHLKMTEYLCVAGAKADAKNSEGLTPLMLIAADAEEHNPLNISWQSYLIFMFTMAIWIGNRYCFIRNLTLEQHTAVKLIATGIDILPSFSNWKHILMNALMFPASLYLQPEKGPLGIIWTSLMTTLTGLSAINGLQMCSKYKSLSITQAIKRAFVVEGPKLISSYHLIRNIGASCGVWNHSLEDFLLKDRTSSRHWQYKKPSLGRFGDFTFIKYYY